MNESGRELMARTSNETEDIWFGKRRKSIRIMNDDVQVPFDVLFTTVG
jgi:hypothetical protein